MLSRCSTSSANALMINISSKTGMETFSARMYFNLSPFEGIGLKEYLRFIANGHGEVHGRGNVVDSKS